MVGAELKLVRRKTPENLSAFDTYLLAMEAKHQVTKESLEKAEALFKKALELDPNMARAYVGLVYTYSYMMILGSRLLRMKPWLNKWRLLKRRSSSIHLTAKRIECSAWPKLSTLSRSRHWQSLRKRNRLLRTMQIFFF